MESQQVKPSRKTARNLGLWLLVFGLLVTGAVLGYLVIDLQYRLEYSNGRFDAALDAIGKKDEEIARFKTRVENVNSQLATLTAENQSLSSEVDSQSSTIDSLNEQLNSLGSEVGSLSSEINSLNSQVASLKKKTISRVDLVNENCSNGYIFLDGILAGGTREGGRTHFYIPLGSHEFQACADPYQSRCGDSTTYDVETEVFTFTIRKHPSCP